MGVQTYPQYVNQKINFFVIQPIYFKFCTLITIYELTTMLLVKLWNSNFGQSYGGTNIFPIYLTRKNQLFAEWTNWVTEHLDCEWPKICESAISAGVQGAAAPWPPEATPWGPPEAKRKKINIEFGNVLLIIFKYIGYVQQTKSLLVFRQS